MARVSAEPATTAFAALTMSRGLLLAAEPPAIVVELGRAVLRIAANASPALVSAGELDDADDL